MQGDVVPAVITTVTTMLFLCGVAVAIVGNCVESWTIERMHREAVAKGYGTYVTNDNGEGTHFEWLPVTVPDVDDEDDDDSDDMPLITHCEGIKRL